MPSATALQTDSTATQQEILLEAGTNELEVLLFHVAGGSYGVNVAKVREVLDTPEGLARLPISHPAVDGVFRLRDQVIPLVNLRKYLGFDESDESSVSCAVVTEFSDVQVAFRVDYVDRIHRIAWSSVASVPEGAQSGRSAVTSTAKIDDQIVLMIDFEQIVSEIGGQVADRTSLHDGSTSQRASHRILFADDSETMRRVYEQLLVEAGYNHVTVVKDGRQAWDWLCEQPETDGQLPVDLLITDIEMPQMDGLHLTKRVKEHPTFKAIPVLVLSSLVTTDNVKKCRAVGADMQLSKPAYESLVAQVDRLLGNAETVDQGPVPV